MKYPCENDETDPREEDCPPVGREPLPGGGERPLVEDQVLQSDEGTLRVDLPALVEGVAVALSVFTALGSG